MDLINIAGQGKSVAYTGTAGATGAFNPGAQGVLVTSTTDCYVAIIQKGDLDSLATSADLFLPAFIPIPLQIPLTTNPYKVSAIQVSSGGTIYASPINGSNG